MIVPYILHHYEQRLVTVNVTVWKQSYQKFLVVRALLCKISVKLQLSCTDYASENVLNLNMMILIASRDPSSHIRKV